jgi:hypothetical protein
LQIDNGFRDIFHIVIFPLGILCLFIAPDSSSRDSSEMAAGGTPLAALQTPTGGFFGESSEKKSSRWRFRKDAALPTPAHLIGARSHNFTVPSRLPDASDSPSGRWKNINRVTLSM